MLRAGRKVVVAKIAVSPIKKGRNNLPALSILLVLDLYFAIFSPIDFAWVNR